jgi:DNA-binding PadR family transcriptional regulator
MAMKIDSRPSALGLVVLGMLIDEPMHVYRMQKLLKLWGKDKVVNIRRSASIYQTIERLIRLGLVDVRRTVQTESHPDRIVYGITANGRSTLRVWLREMIASVEGEFPNFPAAVSMLALLTPEDAQASFKVRAEAIKGALKQLEEDIQAAGDVPRLFLLEDVYRTTVLEAELRWLLATISEMESGSLHWTEEWIRSISAQHKPPPQDESTASELPGDEATTPRDNRRPKKDPVKRTKK